MCARTAARRSPVGWSVLSRGGTYDSTIGWTMKTENLVKLGGPGKGCSSCRRHKCQRISGCAVTLAIETDSVWEGGAEFAEWWAVCVGRRVPTWVRGGVVAHRDGPAGSLVISVRMPFPVDRALGGVRYREDWGPYDDALRLRLALSARPWPSSCEPPDHETSRRDGYQAVLARRRLVSRCPGMSAAGTGLPKWKPWT